MLQRARRYYHNTVHPWDLLYTRIHTFLNKKKVVKIGFCSVFPPFPNGAAAACYYIVHELAKQPEIELFLIPVKRKIDKKLFSSLPVLVTTADDSYLDVVIFFGLGNEYKQYSKNVHAKKVVWQTIHEDPTTHATEQKIIDTIKDADLVFALTKAALSCYQKQLPSVKYIPHGVDTSLFRKNYNLNKQFICLFVSRIHYYKGIAPFLDAIPLVLRKDPSIFFRLVAPIDSNSPYLPEIVDMLQTLQEKYKQNIEVMNNWISYENIPKQYADASVLIFPSNNEGFGIPLIEAMSTEIPCIVLNKKPMNEIVRDGITGFCLSSSNNKAKYHGFEFPDPQDIADKILFLKRNEQKRLDMGKNGRAIVLQEYNLTETIQSLISLCKDLLREKVSENSILVR